MTLEVRSHAATHPDLWARWSGEIPESSYLHDHQMLSYFAATSEALEHQSFALLEPPDKPVALVPLFLCSTEQDGRPCLEASLDGGPFGGPAIRSGSPRQRRRDVGQVFGMLLDRCRERGAARLRIVRSPLSPDTGGRPMGAIGLLEPLAFGFEARSINALCIDLSLEEEELLAQVSKYHRRHIRRGEARTTVGVHGADVPGLDQAFAAYRDLHLRASGRVTRPAASFELMRERILAGQAELFLSTANGRAVSALICGQFRDTAFGWSQANDPEHEAELSPRHYLEWRAIQHYRSLGKRLYLLGARHYASQRMDAARAKLVSISEFKARYGGLLLPEISFELSLGAEP